MSLVVALSLYQSSLYLKDLFHAYSSRVSCGRLAGLSVLSVLGSVLSWRLLTMSEVLWKFVLSKRPEIIVMVDWA